MKPIRYYICLLAVAFGLNALGETISISTGDYEPFSLQTSKHGGFVNRVIKEAFKRKKIEIEFQYLPWARALEVGKLGGAIAATSFWFYDPVTHKDFYASEPISEHRELFFHLKRTPVPQFNDLKSLKNLRVGATRGYTYTKEFWQAGKDGLFKIDETTTDAQNLKKLLLGRIDVFPIDEVSGWRLLSDTKNFGAGTKELFDTLKKPLSARSGCLLFPISDARSKDLLAKFNEALKSMKADGTLEKYKSDMFEGVY